jgi:hypothetical protein
VISGILVMALAGWIALEARYILPKRRLGKGDLRAGLPELALKDESEHAAGGWLAPDKGS